MEIYTLIEAPTTTTTSCKKYLINYECYQRSKVTPIITQLSVCLIIQQLLCAAFSHNFYMRHIFRNSFFAMHIVYTSIETLGTSSSSSNCKLRVVQRMYLTKTFCCIVTEAKIIPNASREITRMEVQHALQTHDSCLSNLVQRESFIAYAIRRGYLYE